ncbi:MAG: CPBP family intramembrane metalloprotease [Methanobrevibacter thaueri]|nr:CPBP family intramembrane metalloprotease [Methanobrevibacter thaueri]
MSENDNKFSDYITFPRTFDKYKWYKPLIVLVIGAIIYLALQMLLVTICGMVYGFEVISPLIMGGYESLNSEIASYISYLSVVMFIPSIYVASKIVRDRPFSSYSSSRGGWNWKLYFKCLTIPLAIYLIYNILFAIVNGRQGPNTLTLTFFVICLIIVPLQCIAEEYFMRGFVMQTIGSWFKIPVLACVLQAVIFALMHSYSILGVLGVFIDGLILGFFAWKTNGLEPGSAFHSVNNFMSAMIVALGFDVATSTITLTNFVSSMILTFVTAFALYYIGNRQGWFSEKTNECKLI